MGKSKFLSSAVGVALVLAAPAFAQGNGKPREDDKAIVPALPATQASAADKDDPEIIVTGSRLRDPSFSAPSPLQVLTVENAVQRGLVSVTQMVQETPAANGTQQTESSSFGRPSSNGGGSTTIDLRGMGAARTLVLINGHRIGPAGTSGSISQFDLTMLPFAMVARVDTLTNGASSIYGSDAVAGVVNIITQEDFDGGKVQLYGNLSQHGGGNYYTASLRYGHKFAKGSLQAGLGYTESKLLLARQRKVTACDQDYVFNEDGTRADITNPDGSAKCWGFGYLYKYAGTGTNSVVGSSASYLRPSGATVGTTALGNLNGYTRIRQSTQSLADRYNGFYPLESGGLANGDQAMQSPSRRYSAFASGNFELGDTAELYGEGLFTRRDSSQQYLTYLQTPVLPAANPNSPFNFANNPQFVNQAGQPLRPAPSIILMQFAQRPEQQVDYGTLTMGVRGKFENDWRYDLYGNFSRSSGSYSQNFVYADRLAAAVSASGCDTSRLKSITSCPNGGVNFWRAYQTGFTAAEYDFLIGRSAGTTKYDQWYIDGSVNGTLFNLPAGEVQLAFGGHFRREAIDDRPGDTSNFDTAAMAYYNSAKATRGRADVREIYGEMGVPILRDKPLAQSLNLTLSGGASSFEYGGSAATYKTGLSWRPADWIMFRATQGTSFRQPKLYELFLKDQAALGARQFLDPCGNYKASTFLTDAQRGRCAQLFNNQDYLALGGNANIITGGSTELRPETSFARSVGIVLSQPLLNASVSIDYYYIHIKNSVTRLGSSIIPRECITREPFPGNRFCSLVTRDPTTREILEIRDNYINAGEAVYDGLDIAYTLDFNTGIGRFGSDGQANVQLRSESATFQGDPRDSYLGYSGTPDFLANVGIWYRPVANTTIRLSSKLVGKMSNENYFTGAAPTRNLYRDTGKTVVFDRVNEFYANFALSVSTRVLKDLDLSLTVRNVLDSPPPRVSFGGTGWQGYREGTASTLSFYDLIGRSFAIALTKGF